MLAQQAVAYVNVDTAVVGMVQSLILFFINNTSQNNFYESINEFSIFNFVITSLQPNKLLSRKTLI